MLEAFKQVSLTKKVTKMLPSLTAFTMKAIPMPLWKSMKTVWLKFPQWRHAIVNFPHPLLKQGLIIVDTPGLNAIGTEPELTLNLIPNAHAVLFILAADTG